MKTSVNAKDSIAYGTKVVGGVSPGKAGKHPTLGLPVYDTVKEVVPKYFILTLRPKRSLTLMRPQFLSPRHWRRRRLRRL